MPRVQLFQRIDARCEAIIEQGLFTVSWWLLEELTQCLESFYFHWLQEVITLVREEGLLPDSQAGRSIGYRQALEYLSSVWGFPGDKATRGTYTAKVYTAPPSLSCIEETG